MDKNTIEKNIMGKNKIEKNLQNQAAELSAEIRLEEAINELGRFSTQIYSINNVLRFLYSFLMRQNQEIADKASVMVVCMWQLDYMYNQFDEILDTIADCSRVDSAM